MVSKSWVVVVAALFPVAAMAQSQSAAFHKADLNGDGFINAEENEAVIRAAFKEQDENGDGFIDLSEMMSHLQTHVAGMEGQRAVLPVRALTQVAERGVKEGDANKDDKLSEEEYRASAVRHVSLLDRDQDGRISLNEFPGTAAP